MCRKKKACITGEKQKNGRSGDKGCGNVQTNAYIFSKS